LALGSTALLYAVAAVPEVESLVHIRVMLGPESWAPGTPALALAWASAPLAAAVSGWALAVRAARRRAVIGVWMGVATYLLTILFAAVVPTLAESLGDPSPDRQSATGVLTMAPLIAVFASAVLGGLLLSSVGAGTVWAWVIRRVVPLPPDSPRPEPGDYEVTVLLGIGILIGVFSVIFNLAFGLLSQSMGAL
jgi:hypothetical protein